MLLETLDVKQNDLIIYSQNIYDFNNNYKIILKDDPSLQPNTISYAEVKEFVNQYVPKSLIVYRLLTNLDNISINNPRNGFFITVNGCEELIYTDPIFALKEMEEFISVKENYDIRFRIQQVGLSTLTRKNNKANYAEIFCIDLTSEEALNQNDKVFVDAFIEKGIFQVNNCRESSPDLKLQLKEDSEASHLPFKKVNNPANDCAEANKTNHSFSDFIKKKTAEADKRKVSKPILDIFYSDESLEKVIEGKKNLNIVMKLESKELSNL